MDDEHDDIDPSDAAGSDGGGARLPILRDQRGRTIVLPTPRRSGALSAGPPRRIAVELEGRDMVFEVREADRSAVRQAFKDLGRRARRQASEAGRRARSAYGAAGFGTAVFSGGAVALASTSATLALSAFTAAGALVGVIGVLAGHRIAAHRLDHEDRASAYSDVVEELR